MKSDKSSLQVVVISPLSSPLIISHITNSLPSQFRGHSTRNSSLTSISPINENATHQNARWPSRKCQVSKAGSPRHVSPSHLLLPYPDSLLQSRLVPDTPSAQGLGAHNAPGHTEGHAPGDAPVAGDSYTSTVGAEAGTNQPGEKGNVGQVVGEKASERMGQGNMK